MKIHEDQLERRNKRTECVCRMMVAPPMATYLWWNRLKRLQSVLIVVAAKRQPTDGCLRVQGTEPSSGSTHSTPHTHMCRLVAYEKGHRGWRTYCSCLDLEGIGQLECFSICWWWFLKPMLTACLNTGRKISVESETWLHEYTTTDPRQVLQENLEEKKKKDWLTWQIY